MKDLEKINKKLIKSNNELKKKLITFVKRTTINNEHRVNTIKEIAQHFIRKNIKFKVNHSSYDTDNFSFVFKLEGYRLTAFGDTNKDYLSGCQIQSLTLNMTPVNIIDSYDLSLEQLSSYIVDFKEYHKKSVERFFEIKGLYPLEEG